MPVNENSYGKDLLKPRTWCFHGKFTNKSRFYSIYKTHKYNYLLNPFDFSVIAANNYNLNNLYKHIIAYSKDVDKLQLFHFNNQVKVMGNHGNYKQNLYKKQGGICPLCNSIIDLEAISAKDLHIDHILPISKKGSKSSLSNMRLVHRACHIVHHSGRDSLK